MASCNRQCRVLCRAASLCPLPTSSTDLPSVHTSGGGHCALILCHAGRAFIGHRLRVMVLLACYCIDMHSSCQSIPSAPALLSMLRMMHGFACLPGGALGRAAIAGPDQDPPSRAPKRGPPSSVVRASYRLVQLARHLFWCRH